MMGSKNNIHVIIIDDKTKINPELLKILTSDRNKIVHQLIEEKTESLEHSLSLLKATLESTADGILVVDLQGKVLNHNLNFEKIWTLAPALMEQKNSQNIMEAMSVKLKNAKAFLSRFQRLQKNFGATARFALQLQNDLVIECRTQPYYLNSQVIGRVWVFTDITRRINLEHKLEFQATHDALTHLPNRVLLHDRISQAIATADRQKNNFALLFFDLDRFKIINDSFSHETGDELLRAVAKRVKSIVRASDTLARFGGDEFVLVTSSLKTSDDAIRVANKILKVFEQPFHIKNKEICLSTSIGVAIYPHNGKNSKQLLRNADLAMYQAKEKGGEQYRFYVNTINKQNEQILTQEKEIRRALAKNEFSILYQPQFDVDSQKLTSAEALIRWEHPEKGTILPRDFIPFAESSGLIVPIGEWVVEEVCKQHAKWKSLGLPPIRIAINVAPQQLRQFNFARFVKKSLQKYQVEPEYLEIEITENVIIAYPEVIQMINELKKIGVRVVLDDFGRAKASLNYLKNLHIDGLKIDNSFVQNIKNSTSDKIIITAIIAMAKSLNFNVFAEGVETQSQTNFLRENNCDSLQGFHFSRPVTAKKVTQIFRDSFAVH